MVNLTKVSDLAQRVADEEFVKMVGAVHYDAAGHASSLADLHAFSMALDAVYEERCP